MNQNRQAISDLITIDILLFVKINHFKEMHMAAYPIVTRTVTTNTQMVRLSF